jgi:hypothetical protein
MGRPYVGDPPANNVANRLQRYPFLHVGRLPRRFAQYVFIRVLTASRSASDMRFRVLLDHRI